MLGTLGQSIWLDYIRRDLIASGGLRRLIEEDGLRGMTENPSIFGKAIADNRTVREYTEQHYLPAATAYRERAANKGALGRQRSRRMGTGPNCSVRSCDRR